MKPDPQDEEPSGVAAASPPPEQAAQAPAQEQVQEPAAEQQESKAEAKPSPLEQVLDAFPELNGKQAKEVAKIASQTGLDISDALVLAKAKHPDTFGSPPGVRQAIQTTPQRTGATQPKREPSPLEAAEQAFLKARAGLITASGDSDRLNHAAATLRAKRALQALS